MTKELKPLPFENHEMERAIFVAAFCFAKTNLDMLKNVGFKCPPTTRFLSCIVYQALKSANLSDDFDIIGALFKRFENSTDKDEKEFFEYAMKKWGEK